MENHKKKEPLRNQLLQEGCLSVQNFDSPFLYSLSNAMFITPGICKNKERTQKQGIMI